jgi:uncharacterized membrane protein
MENQVKVAGHPVHPLLVVFPLGLLSTAVIFDILYIFSNRAQWNMVGYFMIGAGVIGGLGAVLFGFLDWLVVSSRTRVKPIGLYHGLGNLLVLTLFVLSWILRRPLPTSPQTDAVLVCIGGLIVGVITAWMGGELVGRWQGGLNEGLRRDAPSSLTPAGLARGDGGSDRRRFDKPAWAGAERRSRVG